MGKLTSRWLGASQPCQCSPGCVFSQAVTDLHHDAVDSGALTVTVANAFGFVRVQTIDARPLGSSSPWY